MRTAATLAAINVLVHLVGRYLSRRYASGDEEADEFRLVAIATGATFGCRAQSLRRGSCRVVMGGAKIDLRGARLDPEGADLHLDATMGGVEVRIPTHWRVEADTSGVILGGVDVRVPSESSPDDDAPCLRIRASSRLGGIVVAPRP